MINLKQKLLDTCLVLDNNYLDAYIELIKNPNNNLDNTIIREYHHIIPRSYYEHNNLIIDNSTENIIELDIQKHVLAHYYLALCSKVDWFTYGNSLCVNLLTHRKFNTISEEWILNNLSEINNIRKQQRELNSKLQKGLQAGEANGNCKYDLSFCNNIKLLLLEGKRNSDIIDITNVSKNVLSSIRNGRHWSCKEDNFTFTERDTKALNTNKLINDWLATKPTCKNCGKSLTTYIKSKLGDGCFCSKNCVYSYNTQFRDLNYYKNAIKNRKSYVGENNPNYGKHIKHTEESKAKISSSLIGHKPSFTRKHTDDEKNRISKSLKLSHKLRGHNTN